MWYSPSNKGVRLFVKVIPGAAQTKVMGVLGNRLKIRVAAQPEHGKANAALVEFLAKELGISKQGISLEFGHSSPEKNLIISCDVERIKSLFS